MTIVRFVGAYHVDVPAEERLAAMKCHNQDEAVVAAELDSLALIELELRDIETPLSLELIHQGHSDCVPYNEEYFDASTLQPIETEQYRSPNVGNYRVAFHLHYYDPSQPLVTPYGTLVVSAVTAAPNHLANKRYVYWD